VSFLLTLLAFAACLLLGILGLVISGWLRGVHPDMTLAYRHFAFPVAVAAGVIALLAAIVMEARQSREM
jgi:branched-subunit amino acid ABC-type transport system permease component